ncbi:AAA family ATPase [Lichenicoccus sp.]|uniref:nucleotide-binding protein n=1 Tax=Lichenicoccus sp. TaxID=2781899 RepID=UPI003D0B8CEA
MSNVQALRVRTAAPAGAGRVIAVASGKGGVGKTWLSITLAHVLATRDARVLLFDGDFGLANIDIQLGLTPGRDLSDVAAGRAGLADVITRYAGQDGNIPEFGILPGRSGASVLSGLEVPALDLLLTELRGLSAYDTILLDLGAGIDRITRRLAAWADTLLVVTTDEPTALTDAYAVLKLHARDRVVLGGAASGGEASPTIDARIVINQTSSNTSGERAYATLARACTNFLGRTPPLAGVIRKDPCVSEAIRRQALLASRHPNTQAVQDVELLADGLRR